MGWFATNLVSAFLLPPLNLILLGAIGILLLKRRPGLGKFLLIVALTLLYLLSTPFVAETMLRKLETLPGRNLVDTAVQAIVVLGAGTYFNAPEYDGNTVNRLGLERIRYGARLHRLTGKPILTTGGPPAGSRSSEAAQMKAVLEKEFHVPVKWVEGASVNTRENAYKSFAMLKKDKITHIALVTHAWHMPRAAQEFEQAGFKVTPAATAFTTRYKTDWFAFIPTAGALQKSNWFFHEVIGMLWYRLMPARNLTGSGLN
ncbi:MAG: YdcF family protein [Nitrosospira sp.]|nr:YdcF family protein [Nitrosospira sp.]MDN5935321.1 YdcF family protein [Nitrosospira sp.]